MIFAPFHNIGMRGAIVARSSCATRQYVTTHSDVVAVFARHKITGESV